MFYKTFMDILARQGTQDTTLSRRRQGFESPTGRQGFSSTYCHFWNFVVVHSYHYPPFFKITYRTSSVIG